MASRILPEKGNRGTWLAVVSSGLAVLVWILSSAVGWPVPSELWVVLGVANGAAAVRGGLEWLGLGRQPTAPDAEGSP